MTKTKEYASWVAMKKRCYDPNNIGYKDYGGRGITVCKRWENSFSQFYKDMGDRPDGCSIDRIDHNGNYDPANCRWATYVEQNSNTRSTKLITFNGETKCIAHWARQLKIRPQTLSKRINSGWDIGLAITKKLTKSKSHKKNQKSV